MNILTRHLWGVLFLIAACAPGGARVAMPPPQALAADSAIRAAVANELAIDAATFPPRTVAVAPFQVFAADSSLAVLGYGLADLLMTDLSRSAQLQVVDRLRVDALVRELGLVSGGAVDSSTAPRFGRLVGARRLVMGSLTAAGPERARLDGRIGDVVTGAVEATEGTSTALDAILDAEKALAFAIFDRLGVSLAPSERALVEQRPTRNLAALLAYSRGVRAEMMLDLRAAGEQYREALRADSRFGGARERLQQVEGPVSPVGGAGAPSELARVGALALEGVNAAAIPKIATAADPSFRQPLTATIIIIISLP